MMPQKPTADDIVRWLRLVVEPGSVVEFRALKCVDNPNYPPFTVSGYFDHNHLDVLARAAMEWTGKAEGCYVTINPVKPDLLARAANRIDKKPSHTTTDADIVRRVGLVFDADPLRPAGISATDEEKALARERIDRLVSHLTARDWPDPILADSGNGFHARYRIDLPVDDGGLVERVLKAAAARFSDERVEIDAKLANPSRVIKLYGTMARKGDSIADRPHRWTRVLSVPEPFTVVPEELLEAFAAEVQPDGPKQVSDPAGGQRPGRSWDRPQQGQNDPRGPRRAYVFAPGFPDSIEGQNGHGRLYHVASTLVDGFGLTFFEALPIFQDWNQQKAKPPEDEKQVRHKLTQAIQNHPVPSLRLLNANRHHGTGDGTRTGTAAASAIAGPPIFDGPPRALAVPLLEVPTLEPAMLPESLRGWLADSAERMSVSLDYSAAAAIVALATVVGLKLCVRPKRHDDWLVCPNLWGAAVGPPSVLKSACIQEALRPLNRLMAQAMERHSKTLATFNEDALIAKAKADSARKKLEKAVKQGASESELRPLAQEVQQGATEVAPPIRRYMTNDPTIEKLGELLAENPNGLLLLRDELSGFFRTLDRQGHESDRACYLESWNGMGSYVYDRIGRGTVIVPHLCLSIFGGIQPGPLARVHPRLALGRRRRWPAPTVPVDGVPRPARRVDQRGPLARRRGQEPCVPGLQGSGRAGACVLGCQLG